MMCLLCNGHLSVETSFGELFLLRSAEHRVCESCLASFKAISDQHCSSCYKEGEGGQCQDCQFWADKGIEVTHQALFSYDEAMKSYFSHYKFDGDYELRYVFASILKSRLKSYRGYTVVPVPLGPERFQTRGFNQVEGLLDGAQIAYQDILEKDDTKATSSKNRQERLESEFVFRMKKNSKVPPKVLLFDDIYTTGTTLNRLKNLLLEAGCQTVCTFSLAR